jgi:hypothetical protein
MLKKLALLALAAVSMSAIAQDTAISMTSSMDTTWQNYDMNAQDHWSRRKVVWDNLSWLGGGDRYYFEKSISMMTGPQEFVITKALYNLGGYARQLRWEAGMARMNKEWPTYAYNRTTTISTTTDTSGTTTTTTTTVTPTYTSTGAMAWDTQGEMARPLRFAYEMQRPRIIDYRSALEILGSSLDSTEKGILNHWWMNADERSKDILVRLITRQLDWVDTKPLRISYLDSYKAQAGLR